MKNTAVKKISDANLTIRRIKANKVRTFFSEVRTIFHLHHLMGAVPVGAVISACV